MRHVLLGVLAVCAALVALDYLAPYTSSRVLVGLERFRSGLEEKRVGVGSLEVAYLEGGEGEPLLLIHGFGADKDNFTRVAARLTPHYRVLIPDLPGFGDSSRPRHASYAIADQVDRVRGFARELGVGRVHLGGSSMGGFIATQYALAHPEEVASLWLLAPAGTRVGFDSPLLQGIDAGGENLLLAKTPDDFHRTVDFVMAEKPFLPYSVTHVMAERAAADYPLHRRIFDVVGPKRAPLLDERLGEVGVPTLVVFGTEDRALNPAAAEVYAAAMPDVEVIRMEGIGHLPMLEEPARSAEAYLRFRDALEARATPGAATP